MACKGSDAKERKLSNTINAVCSCGAVIPADRTQVGQRVRCHCGRAVTIPNHSVTKPVGPRARWSPKRFTLRAWPLVTVPPWLYAISMPLAWTWCGVVILIAVGMRWYGDVWWAATLLLYGSRWLVLLPAGLMALVALLLRPIALVPMTVAVLVSIGPVMGYRIGFGAPAPRATQPADLRIITFNVESDANSFASAIPQNLEPWQPDVVLLQECTFDLMDALGQAPEWSARQDRDLCIMSRHPIRSATAMPDLDTGGGDNAGSAVAYQIATPGGDVTVVNIHLHISSRAQAHERDTDPLRPAGDNATLRDIWSSRAARWATDLAPFGVVAGDFNLVQESALYRAHWSACTNAFAAVGKGFGYTRPTGRFGTRVDHVLACGGHWTPVAIQVGPKLGSHHRPLIVDLQRNGNR